MTKPTGYSRTQILLHWIIAALMGAQFLFSDFIGEAWDNIERGIENAPTVLVASHIFGGIAILVLGLLRLTVRMKRGAPLPPEEEHPTLKKLAHLTHLALYALMIVLPISGLMAWFGGVDLAAEGHEVLTSLLMILVGAHIAGALYHQFILKNGLMMRMKSPES